MARLLNRINPSRSIAWAKAHPYRWTAIMAGIVIVLIGGFYLLNNEAGEAPVEESVRTVSTLPIANFAEGAVGIAYPTASGDAFVVRAESSGRVNRAVMAGTKVSAGTVVAELDNASERAALTQAQGVYEAAQAGAVQSDIGAEDAEVALTSAKQDAVASNRAALSSFENVLFNTIDELYTNPRTIPGVRIDAGGQSASLGDDRLKLTSMITEWQNDLKTQSEITDSAQIQASLDRSISRLNQLAALVSRFVPILARQKEDEIFTTAELSRISGEFATAQATLNAEIDALESAKTTLIRAEEGAASARVGGTKAVVPSANASIKQALGAYQAAKANYDKTIVRAPFAGTVTVQNVKVGDIINYGADVSIIKPNDGVETIRWWHLPLSAVKYTPDSAFVFIVNSEGVVEAKEIETGLVTASNLRVTGLNGDEQVIEDVRGLKAGDKVEVGQ